MNCCYTVKSIDPLRKPLSNRISDRYSVMQKRISFGIPENLSLCVLSTIVCFGDNTLKCIMFPIMMHSLSVVFLDSSVGLKYYPVYHLPLVPLLLMFKYVL